MTETIKVMSVFGARPDAVKMRPLIDAIERDPRLDGALCVTGQNRRMLDQMLDTFNVRPDYVFT